MRNTYQKGEILQKAKLLFAEERAKNRLDGWFRIKEIQYACKDAYIDDLPQVRTAKVLREVIQKLPLSISKHAIFAGTQSDAFARSYALINPAFKVEEFSGYCDPTAVFSDIEPSAEIPVERIAEIQEYTRQTDYVNKLTTVYAEAEQYTKEVAFFFEQVTGHVVPDFRPALQYGVDSLIDSLQDKQGETFEAMRIALSCVKILAERYIALARLQQEQADTKRRQELELMISSLERISSKGALDLYQAIQLFLLLWQVMCIEQAPNPYAFSVGNADRIFEPYRNGLDRATAAELFTHFLVFFNVGDRSWAISQNILISGKELDGTDLTNETSYALLDAYYNMNLPQPILSVKLHQNTPDKVYKELGRFFFSPGVLTPSLFNDDSLFKVLSKAGVSDNDLPDYAVAGCQEPLIMGKDNGNTTNTWLNLPKILELTITGGISALTGEKLVELQPCDLHHVREAFYENVTLFAKKMAEAGNGASQALSYLHVPFLSAFMGGMEYGADMRDTAKQGTKYNGSGCLVHGLSVIADSFTAIDALLEQRPDDAKRLADAICKNFVGYEDLQEFLLQCPKFGNSIVQVDREAAEVAEKVSEIVRRQKNYLGNPFRPDFSSPSTHLLYGYWVGATPDGRKAREMLGYGVDPLYGEAANGLGFRVLSNMGLPFGEFNGGYASHFGVDPKYFRGETYEEKGLEFQERIVGPLFFNPMNSNQAPFYLYVNVTTPETLRKVLENPKKYAPSGVYIMRIHGTFVNFLDLSPAIQQDIIKRLDLKSTALGC